MLFKQVSGTLEYDVNEPPTRFKKIPYGQTFEHKDYVCALFYK